MIHRPPVQISAWHCSVCNTFKLYNFVFHFPGNGKRCPGTPEQVNYTQTKTIEFRR